MLNVSLKGGFVRMILEIDETSYKDLECGLAVTRSEIEGLFIAMAGPIRRGPVFVVCSSRLCVNHA